MKKKPVAVQKPAARRKSPPAVRPFQVDPCPLRGTPFCPQRDGADKLVKLNSELHL